MNIQDSKTLIFKVDNEEYGVNISQVVSIERMQNINSYPNRQPYVLGVTSIRDVVTPVVDIRSALAGETLEPTDASRMIIVQLTDRTIGLVVDAATDVLDIEPDHIQHPKLLETKDVSFIKGISRLGERMITLLNVDILLENTTNLDELKEVVDKLTKQQAEREEGE